MKLHCAVESLFVVFPVPLSETNDALGMKFHVSAHDASNSGTLVTVQLATMPGNALPSTLVS